MNLIITSLILLLIAEVVRSETCDADVTDLKNNKIVDFEKECGSRVKPCLIKCCGENEVIHKYKNVFTCKSKDQLGKLSNYADLHILTNGSISTKRFSDFHLLHRKKFLLKQCAFGLPSKAVNLTERGVVQFAIRDGTSNSIVTVKPPGFCVDMVFKGHKTNGVYNYFMRTDDDSEDRAQSMYIAYGYMVSSVFFCLVLVIYGMLKELHGNLQGMLLMAFIASLMLYTVIQGWRLIYQYGLKDAGMDFDNPEFCKWLSPITYFLLLSTFTWLSSMSFNIWWTFRSMRKVHGHRQGIYVKLLMYSLYAWGVPAVLTVVAVIIDSSVVPDSVVKPSFSTCQSDTNNPYQRLYKYLPMAILVFTNIVFFTMTIYNIWLVSSMAGFKADSSKNKKNKNQFILFIKLSVIMGMSWILELVQALTATLPCWLFYLLNAFNVFIGVVIFFLMVFKRNIFIMLCKRCGIENRWTLRRTQMKTSSGTDTFKDSRSYCMTRSTGGGSIEFESVTNADTLKCDQTPLKNPRFTGTKV